MNANTTTGVCSGRRVATGKWKQKRPCDADSLTVQLVQLHLLYSVLFCFVLLCFLASSFRPFSLFTLLLLFSFLSLPQVDLMVQALEAKGERPLVVIAEKYIDRVDDTYERS